MFEYGKSLLIASLVLCAGTAAAQSVKKEPVAVVELGGAAFWSVQEAASSFGPSVAVEVTPIENWLELEVGTAPLFRRHSTKKVELMVGVGPEWVHAKQYGITTNSLSTEAVADFMFWRSAKHKFGWYVEPTYEYNFGRGHEQSLGCTGGLLIALP